MKQDKFKTTNLFESESKKKKEKAPPPPLKKKHTKNSNSPRSSSPEGNAYRFCDIIPIAQEADCLLSCAQIMIVF